MEHITLLKLGGSVITDKNKPETAKPTILSQLAQEIKPFKKPLILINGAGSFGHPQVKQYKLDKTFDRIGILKTIDSVKKLNQLVVQTLQSYSIPAISVDPTSFVVCKEDRIAHMNISAIKELIKNGFIPVLFGTIVTDSEKKHTILSGDQIISYLAQHLDVATMGLGSTEDGVYDKHGNIISEINKSNFNRLKESIGKSNSVDITGGMLGKVLELLAIPNTISYIFNASKKGNLSYFLHKIPLGTKINPHQRIDKQKISI